MSAGRERGEALGEGMHRRWYVWRISILGVGMAKTRLEPPFLTSETMKVLIPYVENASTTKSKVEQNGGNFFPEKNNAKSTVRWVACDWTDALLQ